MSGKSLSFLKIDYGKSVRRNLNLGINDTLSEYDIYRDPANGDLRPREGSPLIDTGFVVEGINEDYIGDAPDIGAYEYNESVYWIPGRETAAASMPVPFDGSTDVFPDADLMFLPGKAS